MSAAQLLLGFPDTPPLASYFPPGIDPRCPCDICTTGRAGGRKAGGQRHKTAMYHRKARAFPAGTWPIWWPFLPQRVRL